MKILTASVRNPYWLTLFCVVVAATLLTSCGKKKEDLGLEGGGDGGKDGGGQVADGPKGKASITGSVLVEGAAPGAITSQESDPVCQAKAAQATAMMASDVAVKDGKLGNVFVYITGGPVQGQTYAPASAPAELDQNGCRYHPHVLGIMVGQTLKIKNSDAVMHNVHATPSKNPTFNIAQPNAGASNDKTFDKEEVMVPLSCDVHGWMKSYIGVLPHPFFGVSGEDGAFSIKDLPAGKYTVVAWHEKFGEQKQEVEIKDNEAKAITITFKAQ